MWVTKRKFFIIDVVIAFLGLMLDQFTKYLAVAHLKEQPAVSLIPDVLELRYLENRGAAFGMLQNQKMFFVIMTTIIMIFCLYALWNMPSEKKYYPLHILGGFLMAGALGNFLDRIRLDYVVDFIYFKLIDFPIFNVADIYVTMICVIGILLVFFGKYKDEDFDFLKRKQRQSAE